MTTFGLLVILILCIVGSNCEEYCETPPPLDNVVGCCKTNLTHQQINCMLEVWRKQELFFKSEDKDSFPTTTELCKSNCIFNGTNIITADNKINYDEVGNILARVGVGFEWQMSISEGCKDMMESIKYRASGKESNLLNGKCNMLAEKLASCIGEKLLTTCPDEIWKNTTDCNYMRTYLKNCPYEKRGGHQRLPPQ